MATTPWPFDSIECYNTLMSIDVSNINKPNCDTKTFYYLTHEHLRYGGFAIDVQNANHPRIINRPQMDSLWLRQLVASLETDFKTGLYVPTNPNAEQAVAKMVKRAVNQMQLYADQYWAIITIKHPDINTSCIERPDKESEITQKNHAVKRGRKPVRESARKGNYRSYDSYRPYDNPGRHWTWHKHERGRIYRNGEGLLDQRGRKQDRQRKNKYVPPKTAKTEVKVEKDRDVKIKREKDSVHGRTIYPTRSYMPQPAENFGRVEVEDRDVKMKLEDNGEQTMARYRTRMHMPQVAENLNEGEFTLVMR